MRPAAFGYDQDPGKEAHADHAQLHRRRHWEGPAEWFTGDVYIDSIAALAAPSRVLASLVHFMPGARTAWHSHPLGQSLFVTEGIGLVQRRGGPVEVIRPGDRVYIQPDEEHWHGATT